MRTYQIAVLPGDGIGPEVTAAAIRVLDAAASIYNIQLNYREALIGGMAMEATGTPIPPVSIELCRMSHAALMGPVGGVNWNRHSRRLQPEYAILALREALDLYLNLRPCEIRSELLSISPLKPSCVQNTNCILIRDLQGVRSYTRKSTEMEKNTDTPEAYDVLYYPEAHVRHLAKQAFEIARNRRKLVTSVDKANVLASSRVWRDVVREVSLEYPDVEVEYLYIDNMVSRLTTDAHHFDVIMTDNLFGDFLSEQLATMQGTTALAPSASISLRGGCGLFGGIHGPAESLVGQDACNPVAMILSAALLMRWGLYEPSAAWSIEHAVQETLKEGYRTLDLKDLAYDPDCIYRGTKEFTDRILFNLKRIGEK